ncbi:MAG: DUF357 domain-containing protein [Candidatus Thermoplasmatota archaeon]|nr:DUF357 domain-containing protein [Candidatus Thermoplasmatota archaeon]MBS3790421.1 DUF357 domain-containing protein [Candidatus Thermoplasmatota archaeon]
MVSEERVKDYISKTEEALDKMDIAPPERSHLFNIAKDFLEMAESYYKDAEHFKEKGELDTAFACINYAHGWLDAGARLGLFDTKGDDQLFTLAE